MNDAIMVAAICFAAWSFNVKTEPPQQQQKETAVQQAAENF